MFHVNPSSSQNINTENSAPPSVNNTGVRTSKGVKRKAAGRNPVPMDTVVAKLASMEQKINSMATELQKSKEKERELQQQITEMQSKKTRTSTKTTLLIPNKGKLQVSSSLHSISVVY